MSRFVAEAIGTFALVFFAAGAVMVDELSDGRITTLGAALSSGLVVMAMVYCTGHVSGAHINPAVTLGFTLTRRLRWKFAPVYWSAQLGGAMLAATTLRLLFGLVAGMGGHTPTGGVSQSLGLEIVLTFFLMFVIMAVTTNQNRIGNASGLVIGGAIALGTLVGGPISGGSMNPARSFGPALVGWAWTDHWLYWTGPLAGAALGAVVFLWLTRLNTGEQAELQNNQGKATVKMNRVLFACVHNAGRSQMAEAFAKRFANGAAEFESAGTMPADRVNPIVVEAMKEKGIDISDYRPRLMTQEMLERADKVITMGCSIEEACPAVRVAIEDWDLVDPEGKTLEEVKDIRDQIEVQVKGLVSDMTLA